MTRPETGNSTGGPRYTRLRDLFSLAIGLQGSLRGLSLDDIEGEFEVSRRTAQRMLGALGDALGDALVHEDDPDRTRRWRLRHQVVQTIVRWEAPELAALDAARELVEREGRDADAASLRDVLAKLRALMSPDVARHLDPDLEALIEAQGHAMRPGPRPRTDRKVLERLRHAILAQRKVEVRHHREPGGAVSRRTVSPLGLLYGARYYLVAWNHRAGEPRLFRLSRIVGVRELESVFEPPGDFDLRRYAERSFGVFQEEPVDVVWRFRPEAVAEAREHCFHPTQTLEEEPDGSLLVRFRAGGLLEMAWHLFTWGGEVEVVEPPELIELLRARIAEVAARHRARPRKVRTTGKAARREPA